MSSKIAKKWQNTRNIIKLFCYYRISLDEISKRNRNCFAEVRIYCSMQNKQLSTKYLFQIPSNNRIRLVFFINKWTCNYLSINCFWILHSHDTITTIKMDWIAVWFRCPFDCNKMFIKCFFVKFSELLFISELRWERAKKSETNCSPRDLFCRFSNVFFLLLFQNCSLFMSRTQINGFAKFIICVEQMFNVQTFNEHHWCSPNSSNKFEKFIFSSAYFISFILVSQTYSRADHNMVSNMEWEHTKHKIPLKSKNALNYSFILNLIFIENVHISALYIHKSPVWPVGNLFFRYGF